MSQRPSGETSGGLFQKYIQTLSPKPPKDATSGSMAVPSTSVRARPSPLYNNSTGGPSGKTAAIEGMGVNVEAGTTVRVGVMASVGMVAVSVEIGVIVLGEGTAVTGVFKTGLLTNGVVPEVHEMPIKNRNPIVIINPKYVLIFHLMWDRALELAKHQTRSRPTCLVFTKSPGTLYLVRESFLWVPYCPTRVPAFWI
jgi:hypothetical protein